MSRECYGRVKVTRDISEMPRRQRVADFFAADKVRKPTWRVGGGEAEICVGATQYVGEQDVRFPRIARMLGKPATKKVVHIRCGCKHYDAPL